jgi:multidrug efflux pump subunit AcrA (membrane-fusion protein)
MGRTPSWILRIGPSIVAGLVALLLLLSWIIRYPDSVDGAITITGDHPPLNVIANQSGNLEHLAVADGEKVVKGSLLGIITNAADSQRVLDLKERLMTLRDELGSHPDQAAFELPEVFDLGKIQADYSELFSQVKNYRTLLDDNYTEDTLTLLATQIRQKHSQIEQLEKQVKVADRQLALASKDFQRSQNLHQRSAISAAELSQQERSFLTQSRQSAEVIKSMADEEITLRELERKRGDVEHDYAKGQRIGLTEVKESLKRVLSRIDAWEQQFVLRSPSDGKVAFYEFWSRQQHVTQGSTVFVIVPEATELFGRMTVKGIGVGKVAAGQPVRVRFDDFAYKEYGVATGVVENLSLVAQEGSHVVTVHIDYPLVSSYGAELPFKQGMTGKGSIIVENRRLIGRVFSEIRRVILQ